MKIIHRREYKIQGGLRWNLKNSEENERKKIIIAINTLAKCLAFKRFFLMGSGIWMNLLWRKRNSRKNSFIFLSSMLRKSELLKRKDLKRLHTSINGPSNDSHKSSVRISRCILVAKFLFPIRRKLVGKSFYPHREPSVDSKLPAQEWCWNFGFSLFSVQLWNYTD